MVGGDDVIPARSPWVTQLAADGPLRPLDRDLETDVVVIGAGIAGVSTAWFLRRTGRRVMLIERDRVGRGATGHNAGQLVSYFERPLISLVEEFGFEMAMRAQADVEGAWDLLDEMVAQAGVTAPVSRTVGAMGMWSSHQLITHLQSSELRRCAGLMPDEIVVSEDAGFLGDLPAELAPYYRLVTQAEIGRRMGRVDDRYVAVLSSKKGCANSALIAQQVLGSLCASGDGGFTYFDGTAVERVIVGERAEVHANGHVVRAERVVLCTNGYRGVAVENWAGDHIDVDRLHGVQGDVGYMAGFVSPTTGPPITSATSFIRNEHIGDGTPYVYSTLRPFEVDGEVVQLSCVGGREEILDDTQRYDPTAGFPRSMLDEFDGDVREIAFPDRARGAGFDFAWHGLMAYTRGQVRLIGPEPRNPVLLYNLGCNGVGLLPGILGAQRVASLVAGDRFQPSIFDPR
jgi:glycine/D-amino acid oxidase-like deaminating enzyme